LKFGNHVNNAIKTTYNLAEKNCAVRLHYKDQLINAVQKTLAAYSKNRKKHTTGKMQSFLVKAGGTYSYHCDLRVKLND
jgi:hypothetical protein